MKQLYGLYGLFEICHYRVKDRDVVWHELIELHRSKRQAREAGKKFLVKNPEKSCFVKRVGVFR